MQTSLSGRALRRIVHILVITVFTVALAFPFYWMLITSFKQNVDLYTVQNNPFIFNARPTLEHVTFLFTQTRFVRWLGNTLFVAVYGPDFKPKATMKLPTARAVILRPITTRDEAAAFRRRLPM